ncbi:MAG: VOC family protein, partial [Polyangia bacterium]|nr:VOC family protein [Polyangia bacterium]
AFLRVGEVKIELVQPMSDDSPIAQFLAKGSKGIHHIAFQTDDIEGAIAQLKAKDVPLIDKEPRVGAHDTRIAFVHPKGVSGVLTELVQPKER